MVIMNHAEIMAHSLAVGWMRDFEAFRDATGVSRLVHSMSVVLDEVSGSLRMVGVPAVLGSGLGEPSVQVASAAEE